MNFFWPQSLRENPSLIGRLGRVAHWIGLAYAAGIALFVGYLMATNPEPSFILAGLAAGLGGGLFFASLGRLVRYVLAGE